MVASVSTVSAVPALAGSCGLRPNVVCEDAVQTDSGNQQGQSAESRGRMRDQPLGGQPRRRLTFIGCAAVHLGDEVLIGQTRKRNLTRLARTRAFDGGSRCRSTRIFLVC
jgi:hypothetical protein